MLYIPLHWKKEEKEDSSVQVPLQSQSNPACSWENGKSRDTGRPVEEDRGRIMEDLERELETGTRRRAGWWSGGEMCPAGVWLCFETAGEVFNLTWTGQSWCAKANNEEQGIKYKVYTIQKCLAASHCIVYNNAIKLLKYLSMINVIL